MDSILEAARVAKEAKAQGLLKGFIESAAKQGFRFLPSIDIKPEVAAGMTPREKTLVQFVTQAYLTGSFRAEEVEVAPAAKITGEDTAKKLKKS